MDSELTKNSEAEGGMNRKDGQKQEGGQVHLNVILIRRPLPFLINKIFVIGKVVVARSRPLGLCVCVCGHWGDADPIIILSSPEEKAPLCIL